MLVVVIGLSIHALIIIPLIIKSFVNEFPHYLTAKDVFTSLTTGFTTASSAATLPILMEDVTRKN